MWGLLLPLPLVDGIIELTSQITYYIVFRNAHAANVVAAMFLATGQVLIFVLGKIS
jgi:hypothetical protein